MFLFAIRFVLQKKKHFDKACVLHFITANKVIMFNAASILNFLLL